MRIVPYDAALAPSIEAFNLRLRAAGSDWEFPVGPPSDGAAGIETQRYLCVDSTGTVRGGYNLIHQNAWLGSTLERVGFARLPLSEGIVNPKFAMVGALLIKDAMKRCPLLFSLGMGGIDKPLPRLYRALGAMLRPVPFYFRVVNASNFLRNIRPLRSSRARSRVFDIVAATRLADLPVRVYHSWKSKTARLATSFDVVPRFESWADEVWSQALPSYVFLCGRRADELNWRLPPTDERIHRLRIVSQGRTVGWAAVTDKQWTEHPYFGGMRLGAVVDALTVPGFEAAAMAAATDFLSSRGVDLIVANQLHRDWIAAIERCGYREFPTSNFILAAAPALARRLPDAELAHINRGDGDGPINL